ncbi:MAG: glycosyltransferase N-terminal domain-containing protein [Bacteroidota bacterium]|nr:glycosyltransferase N-terminal domain-containing protein [Bacteroidota bacterium]
MSLLYTILFEFINFILPLGKFFKSAKIKAFVEGRLDELTFNLPLKTGRRYWFHCASLGEFEQAKPIIESLKESENHCSIIITFFSPSGHLYSKDYQLADAIIYLPIDTEKNAKNLIQQINPDAVFFVKYELWFHVLNQLFKHQIPTYLVSAVFRKNQFLFTFFGKFIFNLLPKFKQIFLQDNISYNLLKNKGLSNIQITGDTRYDRVIARSKNLILNNTLETFKNQKSLLILGSSWPEEEQLIKTYLDNHPLFDFKIIIAPHDISNQHIQDLIEQFKSFSPIQYSQLINDIPQTNLLILDTIGHLASAYYYADFAIIGGGFGRGLHNILEPLAFDVPVIFGPNTSKYPEAKMAIDAQVGFQISNYQTFEHQFNLLQKNKEKGKQKQFININAGASQKILMALSHH